MTSESSLKWRSFLLCVVGAFTLAALAAAPASAPRPRPVEWAQPVLDTSLKNLYQVSPELFRSSQPDDEDVPALKSLGIRSVVNLREKHNDGGRKGFAGFQVRWVAMDAAKVKPEEVLEALRAIRDAPKPALVHCWHGSDRTGVVVAAYRMVFQKWSRERAVDEFKNGGFGYHVRTYPNLVSLLQSIDVTQWRKELRLL
jgi:tyrosine-protein phosphatase SIW14